MARAHLYNADKISWWRGRLLWPGGIAKPSDAIAAHGQIDDCHDAGLGERWRRTRCARRRQLYGGMAISAIAFSAMLERKVARRQHRRSSESNAIIYAGLSATICGSR